MDEKKYLIKTAKCYDKVLKEELLGTFNAIIPDVMEVVMNDY